jgi:hypothetical protein
MRQNSTLLYVFSKKMVTTGVIISQDISLIKQAGSALREM